MSEKIEIRCTQAFKKSVKAHAEAKQTNMTTWIKKAILALMESEGL